MMRLFALALGSLSALTSALPAQVHAPGDWGLADAQILALDLPADVSQPFAVELWLGAEPHTLHLAQRSLRAEGFQAWATDAQGELVPVEAPEPATCRGHLEGLEPSSAAASLIDGQLSALIRLGAGQPSWHVQPLSKLQAGAPAELHVVYSGLDIVPTDATCATTEVDAGLVQPQSSQAALGTPLKVAQVACDADYEFYQYNGSSMNGTIADIEDVLNGVALIYQDDADIIQVITNILVRTNSNDPYSSSSAGTLLSQFRSQWNNNHQNITRDVAHLFTGRDLNGSTIGVAWLNVICNLSQAYGLSQSSFSGLMGSRVALTAHELGHNWSSSHCDGDSDCQIMCSGLGGCLGISAFGNYALGKLIQEKNSSGCLSNPAPPSLSSVEPASAQPFDAEQVILTGSSFLGVDAIHLGNQVLGPDEFNVAGPDTIKFVPPFPTALGSLSLSVSANGSNSNSQSFTFEETDPPLLIAKIGAAAGEQLDWQLASEPGELAFLLLAFSDATLPLLGIDVLALGKVIHDQALDGLGLGSFAVTMPAIEVGTILYSQMVTLDGGLVFEASNIGFSVVQLL